jgi:Ser/Thr protein kinase RdoA (MazF antagonist)
MAESNRELHSSDLAPVAGYVAEHYGVRPAALVPVGHDATPGRSVFRCDVADGRAWLLYVFTRHATMPVWFGGGPAREWLCGRTALLTWLERQGYPTPRVIPTREGGQMAEYGDGCMVALTYIPGESTAMSLDDLRQLGALLGRLHALPADAANPPLPNSWWYPAMRAVAPLLDGLYAAANEVPWRWQALHAAFGDTLRTVASADLPITPIHGDCHPGNTIVTSNEDIILIDWECAGIGAAVLDLGGLLTDCHSDPAPGEAIVVDPASIAAVMEGYRAHRTLTQAERDILPAACRFGVAYQGAVRFLWAHEDGWSERIDRSLARLHARYDVAERAAVMAQALL